MTYTLHTTPNYSVINEENLNDDMKEVHAWIRSYIGEDATTEEVLRSKNVLADFLENLLAIQERIDREENLLANTDGF